MFDRLRALFRRTEPFQGPAMLVAGSLWDWCTLTRIDRLGDNLFLLTYLVLLAALLVVERRIAHRAWVPGFLQRRPRLAFLATQFLFGGLYSAYVVFYARSAPFGTAILCVGLLLGLLVVNELADRRLRGDVVRFGLFFFCAFSFLLFFVPVTTGFLIGFGTAGIGAMLLTAPLVAAVHAGGHPADGPAAEARPAEAAPADAAAPAERQATSPEIDGGQTFAGWSARKAVSVHAGVHLAALILLVVLGRAGMIPPVPLSLQESGIFHDVTYTPEGYRLVWEPRWFRRHDAVFRWQPGDVVYCFTAVFAPTGMALSVEHVWERWDDEAGVWEPKDRLAWQIRGGRDGGFRGSTHKRSVSPGWWRVRVETGEGRVLGVVRFRIREEPRRSELVDRIY